MADIDWENEVNATADTPRAALMQTLEEADDIEHILIIASYKDKTHDPALAAKMLTCSDTKATYIKLGLIDYARELFRGYVQVDDG